MTPAVRTEEGERGRGARSDGSRAAARVGRILHISELSNLQLPEIRVFELQIILANSQTLDRVGTYDSAPRKERN